MKLRRLRRGKIRHGKSGSAPLPPLRLAGGTAADSSTTGRDSGGRVCPSPPSHPTGGCFFPSRGLPVGRRSYRARDVPRHRRSRCASSRQKGLTLVTQRIIRSMLRGEVGAVGRIHLIDTDHRIGISAQTDASALLLTGGQNQGAQDNPRTSGQTSPFHRLRTNGVEQSPGQTEQIIQKSAHNTTGGQPQKTDGEKRQPCNRTAKPKNE